MTGEGPYAGVGLDPPASRRDASSVSTSAGKKASTRSSWSVMSCGVPRLVRRGYTDGQLKGIAGGNVLRAMRKAEAVAARLQKENPPSDARIEEVDKPVATQPATP